MVQGSFHINSILYRLKQNKSTPERMSNALDIKAFIRFPCESVFYLLWAICG